MQKSMVSTVLVAAMMAGVLLAASNEMVVFQAGTPILAKELNHNFKVLGDKVAALEQDLNPQALDEKIETLTRKGYKFELPLKFVNDNRGAVVSAINTTTQESSFGLSGTAGGLSTLTTDAKAGVWGDSGSGFGLFGTSKDNDGVRGISLNGMGVHGNSPNRFGVYGETLAGKGVAGSAKGGIGVHGASSEGVGVLGTSGLGKSARFEGGAGGRGNCYYDGGAGWNCTSDKYAKENFRSINRTQVLHAMAQMPISTWTMKGDQSKTLHLGPTAQDFMAAFGLGGNDTTINTADAQGVAMAAIQGLYQENQVLKARLMQIEKAVLKLSKH